MQTKCKPALWAEKIHTMTPSLRAEVGHLLLDFRDLLALLVIEVESVPFSAPDLALHEPLLLGRQALGAAPLAERRDEVEEVFPHRCLDAELAQFLGGLYRGFASRLQYNSKIIISEIREESEIQGYVAMGCLTIFV